MHTSRSALLLLTLTLAACSQARWRREPAAAPPSAADGSALPPSDASSPLKRLDARLSASRACDAGAGSTPVAKAAFAGDVETFHALLTEHPSTVDFPGCQPTALMMALAPFILEPGTPEKQERERSRRKVAIAEELVAKCHEVDAVDESGRTALHSAVTAYYPLPVVLGVTQRLIGCGAVVDARTSYGVTPLMLAVIAKRPAVVKELIDAGADPKARARDGESVLELAKRVGHEAIVTILMRVQTTDAGV